MKLKKALKIAEEVKAQLAPYCDRIEIAGSIRRKKPNVKDIEIVAIVNYWGDIFGPGICDVVTKWPRVKGKLPCKYTQRLLPQGIKLDLFFATPENWGLVYATRTGPAGYSHHVLAKGWVKSGYKSIDGYITSNGVQIPIYEEEDLFHLIGIPWCEPQLRT